MCAKTFFRLLSALVLLAVLAACESKDEGPGQAEWPQSPSSPYGEIKNSDLAFVEKEVLETWPQLQKNCACRVELQMVLLGAVVGEKLEKMGYEVNHLISYQNKNKLEKLVNKINKGYL